MSNPHLVNPPAINPLIQRLACLVLKLIGWRMEGEIPPVASFVLISAPHTSNMDYFLMLTFAAAFGLKLNWMGKNDLFKGLSGVINRYLGGIPIDRSQSHNMVQQMAEVFAARDACVVGILPEGTRFKRPYWKSGFYYIAKTAHVPVLLTSLDYQCKLGRIGPLLTPSDNINADLEVLRTFYRDVKGKYPQNMSDIVFVNHPN